MQEYFEFLWKISIIKYKKFWSSIKLKILGHIVSPWNCLHIFQNFYLLLNSKIHLKNLLPRTSSTFNIIDILSKLHLNIFRVSEFLPQKLFTFFEKINSQCQRLMLSGNFNLSHRPSLNVVHPLRIAKFPNKSSTVALSFN